MDHGHMDHGHMGHGDMNHDKMMCNMNMLFTWDTHNLCIVFRQWRITGTTSLIFSLLAIVALTAGYELVRELSRRYEMRCRQDFEGLPNHVTDESSSLLSSPERDGVKNATTTKESGRLGKAAFYAVQVFYSFFIMLLFMTYNGWVMLAVAAGAFVGYLIWGGSNVSATKSVACH